MWFGNNNGCGCLWIIILLIILFCCCGNNGMCMNDCDDRRRDNGCGCDNNCC